MNQIPNIEEWKNVTWNVLNNVQTGRMSLADAQERLDTVFHQQLQKAREEERERIEAIFKEHVPPHAMDLEDSVWLKRLLNKAFNHNQNV